MTGSPASQVLVELDRRHRSNCGLITVRDDPEIAGLHRGRELGLADSVEHMDAV